MKSVEFLLTGDESLSVQFGCEISTEINLKVMSLKTALENKKISGIIETVPSYRSLMIHYKPEIIRYEKLLDDLKVVILEMRDIDTSQQIVVEIPVLYGGKFGEDIQFVAEHNKKSVEEVIKIHSKAEYLIYMLGFTPGFPYLGGMSSEIATPRMENPRVKIEEGSVGIAGEQTGIYPIASPGGWRLIGSTPVKLYDLDREFPILLKAGQYIKFLPITENEYYEIKEKVSVGSYICNTYKRKWQ